ncbi:DUF4430 domain-containing protein [Sporosarcina sp. 6E9]|uniref:DUF4430 domain-containing protein n=1 Tax=Sporosarcina sp. 6E9 TaxID=2819235 RepID=UPI001B30B7F4|nr:DUF4430 domain-containing protein [Sporosarcina sp. 6E9]
MNDYLKKIVVIVFALMIVIGLSGCGTSLQKPSGLEKSADQMSVEKEEKQLASADETDEKQVPDDEEANPVENTEGAEVAVSEDDIDIEVEKQPDKVESSVKSSEKNNSTISNEKSVKTTSESSLTSTKKSSNHGSKVSNKTSVSTSPKSDKETKKEAKKEPKKETKKETKKEPKEEEKTDVDEEPPPVNHKSKIVHSIVISGNEVPLPPTEMEIEEYDTVLQALISITMEKKIHMDYRGGQGATAYVQGMGNVYEFDRGQGSGWMYRVNGIFPDRGAGVVPLLDGDRVEWLYTTNLGVDLGADLKPFRR